MCRRQRFSEFLDENAVVFIDSLSVAPDTFLSGTTAEREPFYEPFNTHNCHRVGYLITLAERQLEKTATVAANQAKQLCDSLKGDDDLDACKKQAAMEAAKVELEVQPLERRMVRRAASEGMWERPEVLDKS